MFKLSNLKIYKIQTEPLFKIRFLFENIKCLNCLIQKRYHNIWEDL